MMDEKFMREAIRLAAENVTENLGGPFGAVVVKDNRIVGIGQNKVVPNSDPTAHAEVVAIRDAAQRLGTHNLQGCVIYSSCEPCPMCLGAIYWARLSALYFAASRHDAAEAGFDDAFIYEQIPLPPGQRSLPNQTLLREEALMVFEAWKQSEQKIPY